MRDRGVFRNSIVVGIIIFISRISGLIRDFFVAKYLGAGKLADSFLVAFKIPNLFRSIFAEGAFNSSFIPIFSGILLKDKSKNKIKAKEFCKSLFAILFYILLIFTLIVELLMPFVVDIFAPGFEFGSDKYNLAIIFSRITFPFLFFISITSFFGSILNALNVFKPYALSPIILNLCIIFSLIFFGSVFPTFAHAASYGVLASGVLQLLFLFFIAKKYGFGVISFNPVISKNISLFFKKIVPGILGAGIYHVNVMIGSLFASSVNGAVSWLYYADRLIQLPVGVIGVAIATVMLPKLSFQIQKNNILKSNLLFNKSFKFSTLLVMPSALAMIAISYLLVNIFFERGVFTNFDTVATSSILKILSLSLPALVYAKLLSNMFYARGDTKSPMIIAFFTMLINLCFTFIFYRLFSYLGIVISIALSNWMVCILLYILSYIRGYAAIYKSVWKSLLYITISSIIMAVCLYFSSLLILESIKTYSFWIMKLLILLLLILFSGMIYFVSLIVFKEIKLSDITKFLNR